MAELFQGIGAVATKAEGGDEEPPAKKAKLVPVPDPRAAKKAKDAKKAEAMALRVLTAASPWYDDVPKKDGRDSDEGEEGNGQQADSDESDSGWHADPQLPHGDPAQKNFDRFDMGLCICDPGCDSWPPSFPR